MRGKKVDKSCVAEGINQEYDYLYRRSDETRKAIMDIIEFLTDMPYTDCQKKLLQKIADTIRY